VPLLDFKKKVVGYWEDPDWHMDFTTMDDTGTFSAAAALDASAPRALRIASFQVSPNGCRAARLQPAGARGASGRRKGAVCALATKPVCAEHVQHASRVSGQ